MRRTMGLYDFTFYDLINRNAVSYGQQEAWFDVDSDRSVTFSEYRARVHRLASSLRKFGIQKGDRVGVLGKNSFEYFLVYGAAAALGAIVLPINWRLSGEEIGFNLNDCGPKIVFVDREFQATVDGLKEKLPSVEAYFNLGPDGGRFSDFGPLMDSTGDFEPSEVSTDDGFVIIHTAAVAGRPRGALLTHGNVLCAGMHFNYLCNLTSKDVHLNLLPLFHVGGLFSATSSFHAGALNVNMSKFDAVRAVALIQEKRVSFMFDFSPILASILDEHEKTGADIGCLRAVPGLESPETIERYQKLTGGTF
jgi:acyl-CoA synthetase (AMP-forming)/AMP-acid ligase II